MRKEKHNGLVIEIYDSIEERPAYRHMNFNKNLMIEAGVGSDLNAYYAKQANIIAHIEKGNKLEARQEMENLRQNLAFIMQSVSPKMIAFCYIIHSINGKKVGFMTDDKAQELIDNVLNKVKVGFIDRILAAVKKKTNLSSLITSQS
tara:strand:- start:2042 stop:2482 length:441 start_codon:yes stop_codon:yes gene_type:complete